MPLAPGTRIGAYDVIALLGAGGMGEVYRARDTQLNRDVALKVLPESVAGDTDRLMRFKREAQTLAALNHPHIAQIFGLEQGGGLNALVMECVEGEDLSQRIARGALSLDDALPIAHQIAEALEAAHEIGIVHRDLKPANIKVRPDGTVRVLDFGLAKALDQGSGIGDHGSGGAANSPTITSPALTMRGVILGTAAYMAPEQAKGKPVDRRADIWAFGCVLYEMLTGVKAFDGEDVTEILGAIVKTEPDWTRLPAETPATIRTLLKRCLRKNPRERLDSATAVRLDIDESPGAGLDVLAASPARASAWRWPIAVVSAAAAVALAVTVVPWRPPSPDSTVVRFSLSTPSGLTFNNFGGGTLVLAPDGQTLVYTSTQGLAKRRLDGERFEVFETGSAPFFSPDSTWIGFFQDGKLKKVPTAGGLATTICNAVAGRATWGDDGSIVFSTNAGLFTVASSGGSPQVIGSTENLKDLQGTAQPYFLPGAQALLVSTRGEKAAERRTQVLTLADGVLHDLTEGTNPAYTTSGDLLFVNGDQLWIAPLDLKRLTLSAPPSPVLDGLGVRDQSARLAVASNGTLAYMTGERSTRSTVVWIDRAGQATPAIAEPGAFEDPRLSPDGRRLAVVVRNPDGSDVWVHDLQRGTKLRLTSAGNNRRPRWSPDGLRIAFQSNGDIYLRQSDGAGESEGLITSSGAQFTDAWAPDGTIVYNEGSSSRALWAVAPGRPPVRISPASPFSERGGSVSPDGKWLVFVSNESGRDEVYLQPFPGPGAKVAISSGGGRRAAWSRDGREIFYRRDDTMMVVPVGADPARAGAPRPLFEFPRSVYGDDPNLPGYDTASDGRFLAVRAGGGTSDDEIRIVTNWLSTLKRPAPVRP